MQIIFWHFAVELSSMGKILGVTGLSVLVQSGALYDVCAF
jgi:hypothetical protein